MTSLPEPLQCMHSDNFLCPFLLNVFGFTVVYDSGLLWVTAVMDDVTCKSVTCISSGMTWNKEHQSLMCFVLCMSQMWNKPLSAFVSLVKIIRLNLIWNCYSGYNNSATTQTNQYLAVRRVWRTLLTYKKAWCLKASISYRDNEIIIYPRWSVTHACTPAWTHWSLSLYVG